MKSKDATILWFLVVPFVFVISLLILAFKAACVGFMVWVGYKVFLFFAT